MANSVGAPGIVRASAFPSLTDLDPVLTEIFYQHLGAIPPKMGLFFRELNSTKGKETDLRVGSYPDPKPFKGQIDFRSPEADYDITFTHTEFADGFAVERKMIDDMQYENIFDNPANMGMAFGRKVEKDAASVFINAFTAGATAGYDAVALCSASHPRGKGDTANTISNTATLALSVDSLNTVRQTMRAFVDDQGELVAVNPNVLLVPPELEKTGIEITRSQLNPENANNAVNMFSGLQLVVWDYLTDANAWFLIDSAMAKRYLKWYWRVRPEFAAEPQFSTMQRLYRGYMRYSFGWSEWRWIAGSNPS